MNKVQAKAPFGLTNFFFQTVFSSRSQGSSANLHGDVRLPNLIQPSLSEETLLSTPEVATVDRKAVCDRL